MNLKNAILKINLVFLLTIILSFSAVSQQQKVWQWFNPLGGEGWDVSSGLVVDAKNNIYVAGSYTNNLSFKKEEIQSNGNHDMYVARFNEKGKLKWLWSRGGKKYDRITCITNANDESILVAGTITDTVTLGNKEYGNKGSQLFITNLNINGKEDWVKTITYTREATIGLLKADTAGNFFIAGIYRGKINIGGKELSSKGKEDIFIAKFLANGDLSWAKNLGGEGSDAVDAMAVDNQGNLLCSGRFVKTIQVNENLALSPNEEKGKGNAFLISFDEEGKVQWANTLYGKEYISVSTMQADTLGNIFLAGNFNMDMQLGDSVLTSKGRSDIFVAKLETSGETIWLKQVGSLFYDYVNHLNVDNLQGVYITGSFSDTIVIDELEVVPEPQSTDAFIIQFSSEGTATWAEKISGNGNNFSKGTALDGKGNLYITGAFKKSIVLDQDTIKSLGDGDVFLARYYNCPKNEQEIVCAGPLCPGAETELYVARGYKNIVWNDTLTGTKTYRISQPGKYWVTMLDKRGCSVSDTIEVKQQEIAENLFGNDTVLIVGEKLMLQINDYYSQYQWQDYTTDKEYLAEAKNEKPGEYLYWVQVTDSLGCQIADTISIKFIESNWIDLGEEVLLTGYPNPAKDWLYWQINTQELCNLKIKLSDDQGKILLNETIEQYYPGELKQLNLKPYSSGVYYLRVSSGKKYKILQIVHNQ